MTNAEARFNKIHIRKVYACLAVTCHLHFWQNDTGFFTCYCGNTGVERIPKQESAYAFMHVGIYFFKTPLKMTNI